MVVLSLKCSHSWPWRCKERRLRWRSPSRVPSQRRSVIIFVNIISYEISMQYLGYLFVHLVKKCPERVRVEGGKGANVAWHGEEPPPPDTVVFVLLHYLKFLFDRKTFVDLSLSLHCSVHTVLSLTVTLVTCPSTFQTLALRLRIYFA